MNLPIGLLITTTILDTTTLLVLSLSISKYINLKNLKLLKIHIIKIVVIKLLSKELIYLKLKLFKIESCLSYFLSFSNFNFLLQPIILIFDINKNDVYSTSVVDSINRDFDNKKNNIENIISIQKKQKMNENEMNKLENSISDLSNIRDKNIEQFLKTNTKNKFNSSKIIIRNIILGILWAFVFYKLYII